MSDLALAMPCLLVGFLAGLLTFRRKTDVVFRLWCHADVSARRLRGSDGCPAMMRDELVARLIRLPMDADVVVVLGPFYVDIRGVEYVQARDSIVLMLEKEDVRDVLGPAARFT